MTYLVLVVLLNVCVFSIFKFFPKYGINGLQAIVVNYWVCTVTGSIYMKEMPIGISSVKEPWSSWVLFIGLLFIVMFNLLAYSTKVAGITATIISNKLSLVISVVFSILLYKESIGVLKVLGILLAVPGVLLTAREGKVITTIKGGFLLSLLIFIGSGALDTLLKYVEHSYLTTNYQQVSFTVHVFATAAFWGLLLVCYRVIVKKEHLCLKSLWAGIILGIPNFFSIYLFVRLLNSKFLESSAVIPINNIAILILSTVVALVFFKESLTKYRFVGIILSILSIVLIVLADIYGR